MTTLSKVLQDRSKAPEYTTTVSPEDFADEWPDKPTTPERVGLKLVSEAKMQAARANAADKARDLAGDDPEVFVDSFNDALMAWAVAEGTCDPQDITKPWIAMALDNIPLALTSRGIRSLWEQIERLHIASSPLYPEASDAELEKLAARLVLSLSAKQLSPAREKRVRKLLAFVIEELGDDDDG